MTYSLDSSRGVLRTEGLVADGNAKGRGKFDPTSFLGFWAETVNME